MVKEYMTLDDIIITQRDPALKEDHSSWLIWWLVENRPRGMTQWWYIVNDLGDGITIEVDALEEDETPDVKEGRWDIIGRNWQTLGGVSGYGNYFVVSGSGNSEWELGRFDGQKERGELMVRLAKGYRDETIGMKVDYQFFIENDGWYLAEQPNEDNHVKLFYRGSNAESHSIVVEITTDLMPVSVTTVNRLTRMEMDPLTIRFLDERDSWVLPSKVLSVLNWNGFPTLFLE